MCASLLRYRLAEAISITSSRSLVTDKITASAQRYDHSPCYCHRHVIASEETSQIISRDQREPNMGLIDVLNGMQNGPRGQRDPSATPKSSSGGMSPITMAILGLLAYKAMKGLT